MLEHTTEQEIPTSDIANVAPRRHLEDNITMSNNRRNTIAPIQSLARPSRPRMPSLKIRENEEIAQIKAATHQSHLLCANTVPRRATTPDLSEDLEALCLTRQEDAFRQKVMKLSEGTPRFLFRFWSDQSGGNAELNTVDAITPQAFLHQVGPIEPFFKVDPKRLGRLAFLHVEWSLKTKTVHSSWSQSLAFVLDWAHSKAELQTGFHISILDTTQMSSTNVVLHTEAFKDIFDGFVKPYEHEYLIYGSISGPGYRAVPLETFLPNPRDLPTDTSALDYVLQSDLIKCNVRTEIFRRNISKILRLARVYGGGFELPIAAHLLAHAVDDAKDRKTYQLCLTEISKALAVPEQWINDLTIMEPQAEYHGVLEAYKADKILRKMVKMKYGHPRNASSQVIPKARQNVKEPDSRQKKIRKPTTKEIFKATESVANCPRVPLETKKTYPRMVAELHMELEDWETNNKMVKDFVSDYR